MAGRAFHGLSGQEIRVLLAKELDTTLRGDPRFDQPDPVKVAWTWILSIEEGDPRTPKTRGVTVAGNASAADGPGVRGKIADGIADYLARDQTFAGHLTFPRVTWDWRLQMEVTRPVPAQTGTYPEGPPDRPVVEPTLSTFLDQTRAARREGSEAGVVARREAVTPEQGIVVDANGNRFRLVPLNSGPESFAQPVGASRPSAVVERHVTIIPTAEDAFGNGEHETRFRTPTGLALEFGAKPSPGKEAALSHSGGSTLGVVAATELAKVEQIELGVHHPTLAEGGMGAPDAIRRGANLPVPSPQKTRTGSIVDLPANIF